MNKTKERIERAMQVFEKMGLLDFASEHDKYAVRRELNEIAKEATGEIQLSVSDILSNSMHSLK